jgi:hypothetical protein
MDVFTPAMNALFQWLDNWHAQERARARKRERARIAKVCPQPREGEGDTAISVQERREALFRLWAELQRRERCRVG